MSSICLTCGCDIPGSVPHDYCADCPAPSNPKRPIDSLRLTVINALGGECNWCGRKTDLQIDHINNNGAQERLELSPDKILMKVADELIQGKLVSQSYQVLCGACNIRKRFTPPSKLP